MRNSLQNLMITIKNNLMAKNSTIFLEEKNNFCNILDILWEESLIHGYKRKKSENHIYKGGIIIYLKYVDNLPTIKNIKFLSKPGFRYTLTVKQMWKLSSTKFILIVSTNKGFMTLENCKRQNIGGQPFVIITI